MIDQLISMYMMDHLKDLKFGMMSDYFRKLNLDNEDVGFLRLSVYIHSNLKADKNSFLNSQTIIIEPGCINGNRNMFFKSINRMIELNILSKIEPNKFLVNPAWHSVLDSDQLSMFNYLLSQELIDKHFSSFVGIQDV